MRRPPCGRGPNCTGPLHLAVSLPSSVTSIYTSFGLGSFPSQQCYVDIHGQCPYCCHTATVKLIHTLFRELTKVFDILFGWWRWRWRWRCWSGVVVVWCCGVVVVWRWRRCWSGGVVLRCCGVVAVVWRCGDGGSVMRWVQVLQGDLSRRADARRVRTNPSL